MVETEKRREVSDSSRFYNGHFHLVRSRTLFHKSHKQTKRTDSVLCGERGGDTMKIRRDLIVVALATFCLTATMFMVVTSRSADDPNWNPWADLQDDGTVDIYDAITLANAYGSSGDTTKNVNVTNWPY